MDDFFADLARLYRDEIADLADAGCRYIQFDDTNLAYLCDSKMRADARARGEDPDELPRTYAALINACIKDRPADMTACVHLCRGNARSLWFAEGDYEPIADHLFNLTEVDGFFLEYDDERSGGFAPLRYVPKGSKKIVLGLVTSKRGEMESRDELKRRIEEASAYVDLDQLCLSPQCGFSSNAIGNLIGEQEQFDKLAMIVDLAERGLGFGVTVGPSFETAISSFETGVSRRAARFARLLNALLRMKGFVCRNSSSFIVRRRRRTPEPSRRASS